MKILVISNCYPPYHAGGYGVLCYQLSEGLAVRGHSVTVLTARVAAQAEHPGGFVNSVRVERALHFTEPSGPVGIVVNTFRNHREVMRSIKRFAPDLIYVFSIDGLGYEVYHTAIASGVPVVTVVGDTWLAQTWRDLPRFDRWIALANGKGAGSFLRLAKRLIGRVGKLAGLFVGERPAFVGPVHAISTFLLDDLRFAGLPLDARSVLIRIPLAQAFLDVNGYPIGPTGADYAGDLRVLFLSRMEILKGPDTAIRALAAARRKGGRARLTLAGIGAEELRPQLDGLARELAVSALVEWQDAPDINALVRLYRAHDVFVFPSRITEGLGMVCVEAMACGLPVIGSVTGGQADLIDDGKTGYRVDQEDYESIAGRLCELDADRSLLARLSRAAQERASLYNGNRVLDAVNQSLMEMPCVFKRG